jgi:hypothetical protein
MSDPVIHELSIDGFPIFVNERLGVMSVTHDGSITWDQLQDLKNQVWGPGARAIEVYPAQADVVNGQMQRHLWRLGAHDFCPDLMGNAIGADSLAARHAIAWTEARS